MKNLIAALLAFGFALTPLAAEWKNTRGYKVQTPKKYDAKKKYPFILSLHGFTGNGAAQRGFFPLMDLADKHGFLYSYPSGIDRSWNATPACCDWANKNDDSAYLRNFILWAAKKYSIDKKRIYVTGLSNGGFMSYRMAQDHADLIAAIAPFAGVGFDKWPNQPKQPVSVLHIHGTKDAVIKWDGGGFLGRRYPSAQKNFDNWRKFNKCAKKVETAKIKIDLARGVRGDETTVTRFTNEKGTITTELWTVTGGGHVTPPTTAARERVVQWLLAQSK